MNADNRTNKSDKPQEAEPTFSNAGARDVHWLGPILSLGQVLCIPATVVFGFKKLEVDASGACLLGLASDEPFYEPALVLFTIAGFAAIYFVGKVLGRLSMYF